MAILGLFLDLLVFVLLLVFFYHFWRGAVFVPTSRAKVEVMMKLANIQPGVIAADVGSGDGRLVIAMARAGAIAHGYEINPLLVWWSRRRIRKVGLQDRAFIHRQDFWKVDFSQFSVVTVFGIGHIMRRLNKKLAAELKPGARVISYAFGFPNWTEIRRERGVYLYEV